MKHPATFNGAILDHIVQLLWDYDISGPILDPFAGVGKIHNLRPDWDTFGIEIEPEWAEMSKYTVCADMFDLPDLLQDGAIPFPNAIVTSPAYGNRLADSHNAKDKSTRYTYKHVLGRDLHEHNSGQMQWGDRYREFHEAAWLLLTEGTDAQWFVLNIKDHIRKRKRQHVSAWHDETLTELGWNIVQMVSVTLAGLTYGSNAQRIPYESVIVYNR